MKPEMPGQSIQHTTYVCFSVAVAILGKFNSDIKYMVDATGVASSELLGIYFSTRDIVKKISKGYFEKPKPKLRQKTLQNVELRKSELRKSRIRRLSGDP